MNKTPSLLLYIIICSALSGLTVLSASAQDKKAPLSLSTSVGIEFDSNLTVDAIDNTSNIGDRALVFEASAGYEIVDDDQYGLSVGYDFFQSKYDDLDNFDMNIHGFNTDGRYTINNIDIGLAISYNTVGLGGENFLDLVSFSPNIGFLTAGNKLYVIGALNYQSQSFKQVSFIGRDASRYGFSATGIYILGGGKTATASYEWTDHNTEDPGFSFSGHTINFSIKIPIEFMNRTTLARAGYRYQDRGFQLESLQYNAVIRDDKRHRLSASWEVPISNGFFGKIEFEHLSSISNYAPVDFKENIATFRLGWEY